MKKQTFLLMDYCGYEAAKQGNSPGYHAIQVVDEKTGQVRFIKSGSRISFLSGEISAPGTQKI